jgi:hypothetical protein
MWSTDVTGRLRVVVAIPAPTEPDNQGFKFTDDGKLYTGAGGGSLPSNGSILTTNDGRMCVAASQPAQVYNKGWPMMHSGSVIQHLDVAVPPGTPLNNGVAMDDTGVYMTTA